MFINLKQKIDCNNIKFVYIIFFLLSFGNNLLIAQNIPLSDQNNSFLCRNYLTGNWWGIRDSLTNKGIDFGVVYTVDGFITNPGYYKSFMNNFDFTLSFDMNSLLEWNGASFQLQYLGDTGGRIADKAGVVQGISSIGAVPAWEVYQIFFQQNLINDHLSFLFGLYDLNSEFDTRQTSNLFINPSQGIGPDFAQSGKNGPSIFPVTSLSFRSRIEIGHFYLQSAVLDGVPGDLNNPQGTHIILNKEDGLLIVNEAGASMETENDGYLRYSIGSWFYTAASQVIADPKSLENNFGIYASFENFIGENTKDKGLSYFLRVGYADKNVNRFDAYIGGGITFKGLFQSMDDDLAGISFAFAHSSSAFRNINPVFNKVNEADLEMTYKYFLTPFCILQPDIQYIINPGNSPVYDNFVALGIRLKLVM